MSWHGLKGSAVIYEKATVCNHGDTVENIGVSVSVVERRWYSVALNVQVSGL